MISFPQVTLGRAWASLLTVAAGFTVLSCDDATGPASGSEVAVAFRTASPGTEAAVRSEGGAGSARSIDFSGTNGALSLETAHLVITDFELRRANVSCADATDEDACEKFEAGPVFVDLPLEGGATVAVRQPVPPDSYSGLEFEVDDLEDDADDDDHQSEMELLADIRDEFPEWPEDGSLRVTGTFTPDDGGQPRGFAAYFEAEIEIEREFPSPLVVEEGAGDRTVTVTLAPSVWFTRPDGSVVDLSRFDFAETGRVGEFEVEIEDGVTEVEIGG